MSSSHTELEKPSHWYVVGESTEFLSNQLYKRTIWNNEYVVWKTNESYYALDNHCSHRGASLSNGELVQQNIICPYHGYAFNSSGILCSVPGHTFKNSACQNIKSYQIQERHGWIYVNTQARVGEPEIPIFEEREANDPDFTTTFFNLPFTAYARILSENSLDVMHIAYVHSFGNKQVPSPIQEIPPKKQEDYPYHYKTQYVYTSGEQSIAKMFFNSHYLDVDNEFILPHTQIVRVHFNTYTSTIITFATPINYTHSHLYMKTHRSYWYKSNPDNVLDRLYNYIGDCITYQMMKDTAFQDREVIEKINPKYMKGNYNMKYDKLQNVYRTIYGKKYEKKYEKK